MKVTQHMLLLKYHARKSKWQWQKKKGVLDHVIHTVLGRCNGSDSTELQSCISLSTYSAKDLESKELRFPAVHLHSTGNRFSTTGETNSLKSSLFFHYCPCVFAFHAVQTHAEQTVVMQHYQVGMESSTIVLHSYKHPPKCTRQ